MATDPSPPSRMSLRRGQALTGLSRAALAPLQDTGREGYKALPLSAVERILERPVTWQDWLRAGNEIATDAALKAAQ